MFTKSLKSDEVLPAHYALYWWRRKAANQTFRETLPRGSDPRARQDLSECPADADLEPRPSRWVTGQNTGVTDKVRPAFLIPVPLCGTVIIFMVWFMENQEAGSVSEVLPRICSPLLCPFLGPYQPDLHSIYVCFKLL